MIPDPIQRHEGDGVLAGSHGGDDVRRIMAWAAHTILMIAAALWLAALASIGMAEILHHIRERDDAHGKVCVAVKDGVIGEWLNRVRFESHGSVRPRLENVSAIRCR